MKKGSWLPTSFVIFVLVVLGLTAIYYGPRKTDYASGKLFDFQPEVITNVDVITSNQTLSFQKGDGAWRITSPINARANGAFVNKVVSDLVKSKIIRTISKNAESASKYGLDASGIRIVLKKSDKTMADVILGNSTTDNFLTLKESGKDSIYAVSGIQKDFLNQPLSGWRDMSITSLDYKEISSIQMVSDIDDITFTKQDGAWQINRENFELDENVVNALASALSSLQATSFAEEGESPDFSNPQATYTVTTKDETSDVLIIGLEKEEANLYYLKKEGDDTIYLVSDSTVHRLLKSLEDFRKQEVENEEQ